MQRPNILYIMSDDHAINAISTYGSRLAGVFKTPNLDRIAVEGARLDNFFATNSICTPARATVMTGQYGHINGVKTLAHKIEDDHNPFLSSLLQESGYSTAMIGKWHLHTEPRGFDHYSYLLGKGGQGTYQNPEFKYKNGETKIHNGYVTDIITDMTIEWMKNRDKDKPFFMMCHHKAPHDFWEYPIRHENLFEGKKIPVPDSLFEDKSHRSEGSREYGSSVTPRNKIRSLYAEFCDPDYVTGPLKGTEDMTFEEKGIAAYQKYLKDYLRTVAGIDDSVGEIMDYLKNTGELDNTIIIYTSDQGMFLGEHDYQDKRWSYEESLRTPFLIRYPKGIKDGTVKKELMANLDIAPTLLEYAGVEIPREIQGISQKSMIEGDPDAIIRDEVYFRYWMHMGHRHQNPAHYGIRTERYKLIFYYGLPLDTYDGVRDRCSDRIQDIETPVGWELYDMKNDPYELKNLYDKEEYTEVVKDLTEKLLEVKKKYGDTDEKYPELIESFEKSTGGKINE